MWFFFLLFFYQIQRDFGDGVYGSTFIFVDIWYTNSDMSSVRNACVCMCYYMKVCMYVYNCVCMYVCMYVLLNGSMYVCM